MTIRVVNSRFRKGNAMSKILIELVIPDQGGLDQLCWAAVGSGISAFYKDNPPLRPCEIAKKHLVKKQLFVPNCCDASMAQDCNKPGDLAEVFTMINHLDRVPIEDSVAFDTVKQKTNAELPVCARVDFDGQGGHFVAIGGYDDSNPENILVRIYDPQGGQTVTLPFDKFKTAYLSAGVWTRTFFTKK